MRRQKNAQSHIQQTTFNKRDKIYDRLIESCIILLIILTPLAYGAVLPQSIAIFEVTAALMFLLWILRMLSNSKLEFTSHPLTPFIFLFIFYISLQLFFTLVTRHSSLVTLSVSDVWSPGSIYPWATKTELLKVISYAMIFIVTLNTIKTRQQINRMLSIIIAVGFVMGVFFIMRYLGAEAPQGFVNPDHYSAYLGMIIPLAFGFLLVTSLTTERYTQIAMRVLLFFCVIVMSTALFFTMSRGGMFSFILALLFMALLVWRRKPIRGRGWIMSANVVCIILTIAWLGATPVVERILSIKAEIASKYIGGRLPIWEGTFNIIKDYPLF
ncbi:MAG: O-antigen ligase family protein, partial [Candidatus Mariimomonas ferrooxydans]